MEKGVDTDKTALLERIDKLCAERGIKRTTAFEESGVKKNFGTNLKTSKPTYTKLKQLADYFNVTVEYLLGIENEAGSLNTYNKENLSLMLDWLKAHGYDISLDDQGQYIMEKDGQTDYYSEQDMIAQSEKVKQQAENGYDLAMQAWEQEHYPAEPSGYSRDELYILHVWSISSPLDHAKLLTLCGEIEKKESLGLVGAV